MTSREYMLIRSKKMKHLCAIYEIINFLHEIIQKDGLTEAEAQVPGEQTKKITKENFESYSVPYFSGEST